MVRWYIQNEVVSGAYGSGNKFGIERIRRFKAGGGGGGFWSLVVEVVGFRGLGRFAYFFSFGEVSMKATQPLMLGLQGLPKEKQQCPLPVRPQLEWIRRILGHLHPRINAGMNFGVRVAFDFGNCTGPSCIWDWKMLSSTWKEGQCP